MKNIKRLTAVLLYIFIMSFLLDYELSLLFNLKQICLVILGMFILFLPSYKKGEDKYAYAVQLSRCALFASYIQTFVSLIIILSTEVTPEQLMKEAGLSCRPLLYGLCIWMVLTSDIKEKSSQRKTSHKSGDDSSLYETAKDSQTFTASEAYEKFRDFGLTNREAELAVQICKGLSNAEIAAEFNISETTVKKHVSNIFDKLGVSRREQIKDIL